MDYTFLLGSLENILGKRHKRARGNHAFNCPFCNHRKPKLEINMATNEEGKNFWECWVCQTRGTTIRSLLFQLKTPTELASEVMKYLPKGSNYSYTPTEVVQLPKEYQPLYSATTTSIIANKIRKYLYERGLTDSIFLLQEVMMETILNIKTLKLRKI